MDQNKKNRKTQKIKGGFNAELQPIYLSNKSKSKLTKYKNSKIKLTKKTKKNKKINTLSKKM